MITDNEREEHRWEAEGRERQVVNEGVHVKQECALFFSFSLFLSGGEQVRTCTILQSEYLSKLSLFRSFRNN